MCSYTERKRGYLHCCEFALGATLVWIVSGCTCSVLQCVAVWCSIVQRVAVRCSAFQCIAVCCSVLTLRRLRSRRNSCLSCCRMYLRVATSASVCLCCSWLTKRDDLAFFSYSRRFFSPVCMRQGRGYIFIYTCVYICIYVYMYFTLYIYIYIYTNIHRNIYLPNGLQCATVCSYSVILVWICIYVQCKGEGVEGEDHTI